jgi:hypothetical protein
MSMSRLALCETDHESGTRDNRGCGRCPSDDAVILREWAMMTPSVVTTNLLIRSRNLGCAGKKEGVRQPPVQRIQNNKY